MALEAKGACRRFFRRTGEANYFCAVEPTDFTLRQGELTVLMGRSGSGKTTLLNMLAGLLTPSEGQVLLDGTDLYALSDAALSRLRNEHIGVIPQGQTALHSLSVLENVAFPATMYRPRAEVEKEALALLERFDIPGLRDARHPRRGLGRVPDDNRDAAGHEHQDLVGMAARQQRIPAGRQL